MEADERKAVGGSKKPYLWEMDDPYILLAHHIVGYYRPADVCRILTDASYIKNRIIKEVREQDLCGHYVDCIIENVIDDKDRMKLMHQLDQLANWMYSRLDKERLRNNVQAALESAGIDVSSYSTAGKVSSAKTTDCPTRKVV